MSSTTAPEKHEFQAEIAQLLDLVVHSLYTDKEIFVRELISNAADASEKLRFLKTSGQEIIEPDAALKVTIATDETAKTITFTDAGIGMSHGELIENLGTIAHSGSKAFIEQLKAKAQASGSGAVDATLIGQFGVGFYSAFMAADKVTVFSRSCRPGEQGWIWTSDGKTGYEIEAAEDLPRGTKVVVHLKDDEFAKAWKIEGIIKRYSNFVPLPIEVNGKEINTVQALWTRNKSEIKDAEYDEFYKYIGHDQDAPLYRLHFNADAPLAIRALLFIPSKNLELATFTREEHHVDLYCKKILIQSRAKTLLPEWTRFLRGVVDSEDLPLNISRETMQDSALVAKLREVLVKRLLKFLDEESKADAEKYVRFFKEHGHCLKEGVAHDYSHREALAKLLRFESSATESGKFTSLADYVSRMPDEQKEIYFLSAANREACEAAPSYEVFREKKWEMFFLTDARDEFVLESLREFDGKKLVAAEKADVKLERESKGLDEATAGKLAEFIKETVGERIGEVRVSKRLVGSPAIALSSDSEMTVNMRRMMKALNRDGMAGPDPMPDLEINPDHALIVSLSKLSASDAELGKVVAQQVADQALAAAGLLDDPRMMLGRMTTLLEKLCGKA
jgi:molecular chaperone HtpG